MRDAGTERVQIAAGSGAAHRIMYDVVAVVPFGAHTKNVTGDNDGLATQSIHTQIRSMFVREKVWQRQARLVLMEW